MNNKIYDSGIKTYNKNRIKTPKGNQYFKENEIFIDKKAKSTKKFSLNNKNNIKGNLKGEKQILNLDDIVTGKDTRTTVMIRNIPIKYTESLNKEAKEYIEADEFGEVDMLPKIQAAIEFLESNHDGSVLITSLASVADALKGKAGTFITFE